MAPGVAIVLCCKFIMSLRINTAHTAKLIVKIMTFSVLTILDEIINNKEIIPPNSEHREK